MIVGFDRATLEDAAVSEQVVAEEPIGDQTQRVELRIGRSHGAPEKHLRAEAHEQFSVEVLAEEIGLSRSQLYRKVIALTGLSVNELIRKLRMQKAAQLLEQKWGPIAQVAYEVGISNLSYFSKIFKEEFGTLPSEYEKQS